MSATAARWPRRMLGEVAQIQGGIQKQSKRAPRENHYPFLRVANVTSKGLDLSEIHRIELFGDELNRLRLQRGDLLVVEGNGSPSQIGRAAIWNGAIDDCVHQNHLIRVRAGSVVLPEYLHLYWNSPANRDFLTAISSSTSGLHTLSVRKLQQVEVPIPPLEEQQRIVAILDDHLSRLDAAAAYLDAARRRARTWKEATADGLIWGPGFETRRVGDLLREPMRNGRSDRVATGGGTRCLTLTAVTRNEFTEENTKLTGTPPSAADGLWLEPGDIFVQRSNTPDLVGTTALFDGPRNWAIFPDLLIRLRPDEEVVDGRYLCAALRAERTHRTLRARAKGLSGSMPKIDQATIAETLVPLPPRERQADIIRALDEFQQSFDILNAAVELENKRTLSLRRSLLAAAFSGELTPGYEPKEEVA